LTPHPGGQEAGAALLLVTRPQEPGRRLTAQLRGAGCDAIWWPAFDLLPPDDPQALRSAIARLGEFQLAVFVSPAAVHAFASAFRRACKGRPSPLWPKQTIIAAMGAATRQAVLESVPGADRARLLCPDGDLAGDGGSEALLPLIEALQPAPRTVLLVRAQSGRQHLTEWLRARGADVEETAAYRRIAHVPSAAQWSALRAGRAAGEPLALLFTSSEAVAIVAEQFEHEPDLAGEFGSAILLYVHERIGNALRSRGARDLRACTLDVGSIRRALQQAPAAGASSSPSECMPAAPAGSARIS
jgi:uroporphyrinogen-III synthase